MTIEEIKRELKNEIVSHRNEKLCTGQTSIYAMATDCLCAIEAQEQRIKELEASQPKWISIGERSPTKKDGDYDGDVLASNEEYPRGFLCPFDYLKRFNITHWMPLPPPPPTEDSSATERS